MSINNFYKQTLSVYSKTRTKVGGVVKETTTLVDTIKGILDKATSSYNFKNYREGIDYTDLLFTAVNPLIAEDAIIEFEGVQYDVISVVNPLYRGNHIEVLLKALG
jgi:hypothetical protein